MSGYKLAIDGPAGSGKSTISALVAKKLGWTHIDTGAMYRAATLLALELGIDMNNESSYTFLKKYHIHYDLDRIYIDQRDVTEDIRSKQVTEHVSLVSSFPYVRNILVEQQKKAAQTGNIIMDGRDIGTVVLPDADLKIFLTANIEERARRRHQELLKKGKPSDLSHVIEDIINRDKKDSTRKESPLVIAKDAVLLDSTDLAIEQVVDKIIELAVKKEN